MTDLDFSEIISRQVEYENQIEGLIQILEQFRKGLIEGIWIYFDEAKNNGLKNIKPLKKGDKSDEYIHYLFSMNDFDIVLLSTNKVADLTVRRGMKILTSKYFVEGIEKIPLSAIASMIYLFREGSQGGPFIKITVYSSNIEEFNYLMEWETSEGTEAISGGLAMTKEDGLKASKELVGILNSFSTTWKENPTLIEVFEGKIQSKYPIGFEGVKK